MDDDKAQQLGDWIVDLHRRATDTAKAFFRDNPSSRYVTIQPTVADALGRPVDIGEPLVFDRKGLGL